MADEPRGKRENPRTLRTHEYIRLEDARDALNEARDALDRVIFELYQDGVTQSAIGEVLDVTQQGVQIRIRRYRERRDAVVSNQSRRIKTVRTDAC